MTVRALPASLQMHADGAPESVAITAGRRHCNYRELWRGASSFARWLRDAGFRAGDRVAIVLPNSPEAAMACYGTWLAGGIAVPLNAQARPRELAPWLRHSEPAVIVHERGIDIPGHSGGGGASVVRAVVGSGSANADETPFEAIAAQSFDDIAIGDGPPADDTAAMILFTSGTTGRPKGVTLSHRNLASNAAAVIQYLGLGPDDSVVSVLPFYYAYGSSVLNTHLAAGGRVVLEPNLVFPHAVVDTIARERATGFSGVPSTFALLLARVNLDRPDLASLRYVTQAGGPMPVATTRRLCAALPQARLFVMYGQTEATARLTWLPPDSLDRKLGSVGKAITGVEIEVRSDDGSPAPAGAVGEVWARGPNVMRGYWRDDAQTSEVLRDGWLKTGDMGHLDPEGFLFLEGRRTDMIKVGAHRVYPKDVEEAISEIPGIAEVAVIGVDDGLLGQVVKAYVVRSGARETDAVSIQAHCRDRLASFKIPKHVEFVDALPKTDSGKIKRRALAGAS